MADQDPPKDKKIAGKFPKGTSGPTGGMQDQLNEIKYLFYALILILFIGFAQMFVAVGTMLQESWNNKAATYQELRDKIFERENSQMSTSSTTKQIDALTAKINTQSYLINELIKAQNQKSQN